MPLSSRRTARKTNAPVRRSRQTRRPSPGHDIDRSYASTTEEGPSFSFHLTEAGTSTCITPSLRLEPLASTKRRLPSYAGEDQAVDKGSKRPRIHPPPPPTFGNGKGRSDRPQPSPQATTDGEDIDDHDGDADAASPQSLRNVSTSFPSLVASSSMDTSGESSQPIQSFFENASNITIGRDFLVNSYITGAIGDSQVQVLVRLLQANLSQCGLSQSVGYNRENGVRIVDALGGELILPPSIVGKYSDIHDLMLKHFNGKLGEERVVESRYCIVTERNGTLVQPDNWDRVLNSGEGLIMCMTVRQVLAMAAKDGCPQCGKTRLGTRREDGWLICRRCEKRFPSSAGSMSLDFKLPIRDINIASFRHIRKEFVKRPYYPLKWSRAENAEKLLFEGEVLTPPQQHDLESQDLSSSDRESDYSSSWSSEDGDP